MPHPFRFVSLVWPPSPGQWKGLSDTIEDVYRRLRDGVDRTITLSGDVTGSGTEAVTATLASVNSNVGTFGDSTNIPTVTVDAKGRVTAASQTAASGLFTWSGKIAAPFGNGDPNLALAMLNSDFATVSNPTPTNISTTVARISYFILPFDLTVNKIRFFSLNAVAGCYSVAIYRFSDLARLTAQLDFDTPGTNQWGSAGSSLGLSLSKDVQYFIAVSTRALSGVQGVAAMSPSSTANRPQSTVLPSANAGNLAAGNNYVAGGQFGQFAVTAGALTDPAATLAIQGSWSGGMPCFFLDNSNA